MHTLPLTTQCTFVQLTWYRMVTPCICRHLSLSLLLLLSLSLLLLLLLLAAITRPPDGVHSHLRRSLLTVVASTINALPKTSKKKQWMNKSDRLIVYKVCVTLASSAQQCYSFIYFSVVFSVQRFLNVQKSLGGNTKIVTLQ